MEKDLSHEFHQLWTFLVSKSHESTSDQINMMVFVQIEQNLCRNSKDYRKYVNFLKEQIHQSSVVEIIIGTFKAMSRIPQYPQSRNSLNYLLSAIKELNLASPAFVDVETENYLSSLISALLSANMEAFDGDQEGGMKGYMKLVLRSFELFQCCKSIFIPKDTLLTIYLRLSTQSLWSVITRLTVHLVHLFDDQSFTQLSLLMRQYEIPPEEYQKFLLTIYSLSTPVTVDSSCPQLSTVVVSLTHQFVEIEKDSSIKSTLISVLKLLDHIPHPDPQIRSYVAHRLKCVRIQALVTSNLWHLAEQIATCSSLQSFLYLALLEEGSYQQAQTVYESYNLENYDPNLPKVSLENLRLQHEYIERTFLPLPPQVAIHHVNDLESLQNAELHFLKQNVDGSSAHRYFGVDAEWKTSMPAPIKRYKEGDVDPVEENERNEEDIESRSDGGASILQIATENHVFLFDMTALGSSTPLIVPAIQFFQKIFSNPDYVKIGWDFNKNDVKKLMSSGVRDLITGQDRLYVYYLQQPSHYTNQLSQQLLHLTSSQQLPSQDQETEISSRSSLSSTELSSTEISSISSINTTLSEMKRSKRGSKEIPSKLPKGYTPSLSDCCQHLLGKPLRKEEQVSNWDRRPLSGNQEVYAALDAHSLLGIFVAITGEDTLHPHYQSKMLTEENQKEKEDNSIDEKIWSQFLSKVTS